MASKERESGDVPSVAGSMIIIIINTITCPFIVLLNVSVIRAVKATPELRTNSNILQSCLAVTDVLTGLFCQPFFILWQIFLLLGLSNGEILQKCSQVSVVVLQTASYFHLMLVTFERLVAIKFTMKYSNIITDNNMRRVVLVVWIISFINGVLRGMEMAGSLAGLLTLSCILFLAFSYCIMYRETRRHQEKIKKLTTAPRRNGKICQREQGAEDNFICGRYCCYLPSSTLFLSYRYSYRPLQCNYLPDQPNIGDSMCHVKPAC